MINTLQFLKAEYQIELKRAQIDFLHAWLNHIQADDKSIRTAIDYSSRKALFTKFNTTWSAVTTGLNELNDLGVLSLSQTKGARSIKAGPKLKAFLDSELFKKDLLHMSRLSSLKAHLKTQMVDKENEINQISDLLVLLLMTQADKFGLVRNLGRTELGKLIGVSRQKVLNDVKRLIKLKIITGYIPGGYSREAKHRFDSIYKLNIERLGAACELSKPSNMNVIISSDNFDYSALKRKWRVLQDKDKARSQLKKMKAPCLIEKEPTFSSGLLQKQTSIMQITFHIYHELILFIQQEYQGITEATYEYKLLKQFVARKSEEPVFAKLIRSKNGNFAISPIIEIIFDNLAQKLGLRLGGNNHRHIIHLHTIVPHDPEGLLIFYQDEWMLETPTLPIT